MFKRINLCQKLPKTKKKPKIAKNTERLLFNQIHSTI